MDGTNIQLTIGKKSSLEANEKQREHNGQRYYSKSTEEKFSITNKSFTEKKALYREGRTYTT